MSAGYYGARLRAQGLVPFRKYNIHTYLHRYIHTHMTYIHYIWFGLFCLLVCVRGSGGARARARARVTFQVGIMCRMWGGLFGKDVTISTC